MGLRNDDSTDFYNRFYRGGGWRYRKANEREALRRLVAEPAGWAAKAEVLEIGCGMGVHAKILQEMGYQVTAMDASAAGIAQAKRAFGDTSNPRYVAADLGAWDPKAPFDGIYSRGMSYFHYELDGINCKGIDVPAQTERLFGWLRDGGTFVLQISTDLSGRRPKDRVHNNRHDDYVGLFRRFGEIVSVTDLKGRPVTQASSPPRRGIIVVTRKA
jgi:cyclopropane fatty-acyl-phospholipid synthase-like methyltransferase